MKIEALCELTTQFLEKSSVMALKVNTGETTSIHLFYRTAAIKAYQKKMLKTRPLAPLPLGFLALQHPYECRPGETLSQ